MSLPDPQEGSDPTTMRMHWIVHAVLLWITAVMFGDLLLPGSQDVIGYRYADLFHQLIGWRQFGFDQLRSGHVPLWNPHVYAGAPYVGGFQSALFYPPNWLFLALPMADAINWNIGLHVYMMGVFFYWWMARRRLHPAACLTGAATLMLSGPFYLHIYAGHLPNLSTMVWVPLILLTTDEVLKAQRGDFPDRRHALRWAMLGGLVTAMQILAGHAQYVFYTAITLVLYVGLALLADRRLWKAVGYLVLTPVWALLLSAIQLLPSWQAASEIVRAKALPYEFAAMFSFPPENLVTLIAPFFWGALEPTQYFGRGYLWEMCVFIGIVSTVLAVWGVVRYWSTGSVRERGDVRMALAMAVLLSLLALGAHTPVFGFLYDNVPGFDRFRGMSKFVFPAVIFVLVLACVGLDALLRLREVGKPAVYAVTGTAVFLLLSALAMRSADWTPVMEALRHSNESYLWNALLPADHQQLLPRMAAVVRNKAATALTMAGMTCLVLAVILAGVRRHRWLAWGVPALALVEMLVFAHIAAERFPIDNPVTQEVRRFLSEHPGDYRIANTLNNNDGMRTGALDVAGNDPGVVGRYAEFMTHLQGGDPDQANQYLGIQADHRLYPLLRLAYVALPGNGDRPVQWKPAATTPMSRLQLLGEYRLVEGRDAAFAAMDQDGFDPRRTVVLESRPDPAPAPNPSGEIQIESSGTDGFTVAVTTERPAIMVITDAYTPSWRVRPLEGSVQQDYRLQPANYAFGAIALQAGSHRFAVEYNRAYLHAGMAITAMAIAIWMAIWFRLGRAGLIEESLTGIATL